ncbi:outer membrane lipoprotein chaperone LolA [Thiohalospira sp.]|uniref:outer membrane lipoprotein chaperone LolA n=1 Tax=Thiohalospira sp. TaxID=3080549 RepID=UPI003980C27B
MSRWLALAIVPALLVLAAGPAAADSARERLSRFYDEVETMRADFEQVRMGEGEEKGGESHAGRVVIHRPGRFRFEYTEPYEQLYVSDGGRVWSWDPGLEQVIIQDVSAILGNTPAALLAGEQPLDETFRVAEVGGTSGERWVELRPREEAENFEKVRLTFGHDHIRALEIVDATGQTSRMTFSDVEYGVDVASERFSLEPPEGADVVDETDD